MATMILSIGVGVIFLRVRRFMLINGEAGIHVTETRDRSHIIVSKFYLYVVIVLALILKTEIKTKENVFFVTAQLPRNGQPQHLGNHIGGFATDYIRMPIIPGDSARSGKQSEKTYHVKFAILCLHQSAAMPIPVPKNVGRKNTEKCS